MAKKEIPGPMTMKVAHIIAECAFATGRGLQEGMGTREYAIHPDARDFWISTYSRSIRIAAKRKTSNWEGRDRSLVIERCLDLGRFTAAAALAAGPATGIVPVLEAHAHGASVQVFKDPRCTAARKKVQGGGQGGYCEVEK